MFFNSVAFSLFLPIVFFLYWFVFNKNKSTQNGLLIIASYYFYSCWDWRFLFLLVFSTFLDYFTGIQIEKSKSNNRRKFWFWLSVSVNLGFLGVFKYYDFFATSFAEMLGYFGFKVSPILLNVILPVGISFYTFHGLSYVIDIYLKRIKAEYNFVDYSLFVSYFPLLVAGPIERATHLLPQVKIKREFNLEKAKEGFLQIIWGLFKKVVIADNCAVYANNIFDHYTSMDSFSLVMGSVYFAFQIYGDFSGYSDIALGVSKLFGIDLLKNFNYPYFSRDIAEFWRRWHISLSSWFRDYVYIPLGGSKGSKIMQIRNVFIIFLLSGFWHGANWTYIIWGAINAFYFLPLLLRKTNRNNIEQKSIAFNFSSLKMICSILFTFGLTCIAWIFFRSESINMAIEYIKRITLFTFSLDSLKEQLSYIIIIILPYFILLEWNNRRKECPLFDRYSGIKAIITLIFILLFGQFDIQSKFIYFQF
ncbi:D-alanyl-lipoteichoic acid acyltransferase DltB (MBOAT superfamily) [Flavobacterium nitrogenifigens]|uniref:D-alanyl-lipoteichoic acid acyltransferase DltB (MBOAT superfamily) n=2 Tax=Flavobacterium TaxID=237 RepID=A0A7W7N8A6_9FLAO|nr:MULTISPECIES: MBOAT family O-acyltransferase [Flavobacterium]MBB4803643.1 D-alanyl-lipoteichoic acid acyltransferase DltB (MBOAT superfamily) [Flavobacterium nitrogenifigens]MBB6388552.1 D-alanyl-lipoteichoic acid acyltransferase DltB (MBOAT superfamily) [Flavobacterium notoginsengisoli]